MSISGIAEQATDYLSSVKLTNITDGNGQSWLEIPGHTPGAIPAFKARRPRFEVRLKPRSNTLFFEETTTLLASHLLSRFKPSVFLDVGAAGGHFSLLAATHKASQTQVHAFDMRPEGLEALNKRIADLSLQDHVSVHLAGLSDRHQGEKTIWYSRFKMFESEPDPSEYREPWYIRLKFALQGGGNRARRLFSQEVLLTSLDAFCAQHALEPGLMKIDVDGYEGKILLGGHNILRTAQPLILLELHKDKMQRFGLLRKDVVTLLFDAGYEALFITDHHDASKSRLVHAGPSDPLFARQQTDMILFCPPRVLGKS